MAAPYITTGKAARRCSVQPDTVLKWVKKGRLPAVRTPGGHYRIDERDLARFMGMPDPKSSNPLPVVQTGNRILHCWEYFGEELRAECQSCVVYRVRASMCFQLRLAMHGNGHNKEFCKDICQDCPYCRRVHGEPTNILVITRNEQLIQRLSQHPHEHLVLRYARSGYDSSAVLAVFRPALAVVDLRLLQCNWENGGLIASLTSDERAKGMRVLISVPADGVCAGLPDTFDAGTIPEPWSPADLLRWADCGEVEILPEEPTHQAWSAAGKTASISKPLSLKFPPKPEMDVPAQKPARHPRNNSSASGQKPRFTNPENPESHSARYQGSAGHYKGSEESHPHSLK
ncbi:MAG: helix-turn-helix domain-containing protein [Acidobacteriaceae bacterium]